MIQFPQLDGQVGRKRVNLAGQAKLKMEGANWGDHG